MYIYIENYRQIKTIFLLGFHFKKQKILPVYFFYFYLFLFLLFLKICFNKSFTFSMFVTCVDPVNICFLNILKYTDCFVNKKECILIYFTYIFVRLSVLHCRLIFCDQGRYFVHKRKRWKRYNRKNILAEVFNRVTVKKCNTFEIMSM